MEVRRMDAEEADKSEGEKRGRRWALRCSEAR
jgi:hypothetical protein